MEADEAGTLARLKTIRLALIDRAIAKCKGRIVKTTGEAAFTAEGFIGTLHYQQLSDKEHLRDGLVKARLPS